MTMPIPSEKPQESQEPFQLLLRTETIGHSPAFIGVAASAFNVAPGAIEIIGLIRSWVKHWKQRKELYDNLFGFCANADFFTNREVIGELSEERKEIYDIGDLDGLIRLLEPLIKNIFAIRPKDPKHFEAPVELSRNLVSIGGPFRNRFSRWMMKIDPPPVEGIKISDIPTLTYTFNLGLFKLPAENVGEHLERREQEEGQKLNFPIAKDGVDLYIPEVYYPVDEARRKAGEYECTRDYGMVIKMKSIHEKGRRNGMKNMMIAGCHSYGTQGAAMMLGEEEVLKEIWEKVGDQDFQVVIAVSVRERKPQRVELLDIVPLK